MKTPAKAHQDTIRKIDILSICALGACRETMRRPDDDYYRGQVWGFQLSISLLASEIPGFASNAFDRPSPSLRVSQSQSLPESERRAA